MKQICGISEPGKVDLICGWESLPVTNERETRDLGEVSILRVAVPPG
jgi:hypothetical protein